jgi:hypothetical protein
VPNARRRWWPAGAVTACWLAAAALVPGTAAAAATVSTTYETPGETPFVVPAGVNTASVMLVGAGGGADSNEFSNFDAPGGAGGVVTACRFKVTPAPPTPAQASCSPKPQTGNTPVLVSASLTGLTPSTTYSVRVTATNAQGNSTGAPKTFKTPAAAALVLRPAGTRVAASR